LKPLLLITRPAEDARRTAAAVAIAGFQPLVAPLLRIDALDWKPPAGEIDALLFTSPQGPRHCSGLHPSLAQLPAYAVGAATARAATAAGFCVVSTGDRDGAASLALAAHDGRRRLLHPCGEDVTDTAVPVDLEVVRIPVYRAVLADALPPSAKAALAGAAACATLLYSARTAQCFAALVDSAGLSRRLLRIACLSSAVAGAAGPHWLAVATAERPSTDALLAATGTLWQSRAHG